MNKGKRGEGREKGKVDGWMNQWKKRRKEETREKKKKKQIDGRKEGGRRKDGLKGK